MSVVWQQPLLLGLILIALPIVVLVPLWRLRHAGWGLRSGILVTRLLLVALLAAALAEPALRPAGTARAVVFALDASNSLSTEQRSWARGWVQRAARTLPPGSQWQTIEFGENARLADPSGAVTGDAATDVGAALRLAGALLPRDPAVVPEIVLLTDGWNTNPQSTASAPPGTLVSYVVPPRLGPLPSAVVRSVQVQPMIRVGDDAEVTIDLQAAEATAARLRVTLDRAVIVDGPIDLEAGDTRLVLARPVESLGFLPVRVDLQVGGQTSTLDAVTIGKPAGHVLVLEDQPAQADGIVALLQGQRLQVTRAPASVIPPNASALSEFDAVVLVNTPATALTLDQQRTLQEYAQEMGRGLVVIGGPRTFAPGGYQGTVLDELLPVSAEPPVEPQQGSLALILVIDRSGSMEVNSGGQSGGSKIAMAREAALQAAALLQPNDTLGVIAFDSTFQWVVPPTTLRGPDDVRAAQAQISAIKAGGGTSILAPLEAAYEAAAATSAPLKHVVLLTDGESNDRGYDQLIERMRPASITLSTLAIGADSDTRLLSSLARLGGGRYYFTERTSQVPRIASKETAILTRNAVIEGRVAATVGEPSPVLRSLSGDFPSLNGYVATTRKDRAVTALETERGHPLLAHWQYGLGRVMVWTSQAQQGWAAEWATWPEAGQFWAQTLRWALPAPVRSDFQPVALVDPDGRHVTLQVQALRDDGGHFADLQDTRATVADPSGAAREVVLTQQAPGTYAFETRVETPGVYRVLFTQGPGREEVAGFAIPDAVESHTVGANRALLEQLTRDSGGRELVDVADLTRDASGPGPAIPLWPWALGLALLLLPLDVFLRRRA